MKIVVNMFNLISALILLWILISWIDVNCSGLAEDPHFWNFFMVLVEVAG